MKRIDVIKLQKNAKKAWPLIEKNIGIISEYLSTGIINGDKTSTRDIFNIMYNCLVLVVTELHINTKDYHRYSTKNYTSEDFVDMIIESIGQDIPSENDFNGINQYVEKFRSILWGHAIFYREDYLKLYMNFYNYIRKNSTFSHLKECMTIIYIECLLRNMEKNLK